MTLLATYSPSPSAGPMMCSKSFFRQTLWARRDLAINMTSWLHHLPPGNQIYLHLRLLCHCWSRTPLRRGGCKKTLQTMHKILRYAFVTSLQIKRSASIWGRLIADQTPFQIQWWWSERRNLELYKQKPLKEPQWLVRESASWTQQGQSLGTQHQLHSFDSSLMMAWSPKGSDPSSEVDPL